MKDMYETFTLRERLEMLAQRWADQPEGNTLTFKGAALMIRAELEGKDD
jgi:hypothetical protein